jgi:hypothetical protein
VARRLAGHPGSRAGALGNILSGQPAVCRHDRALDQKEVVMSRKSLWLAALVAIGGALVATLLIRLLALAVLDVSPEFPPLAGPGPTIFFTVIPAVAAVCVYALVRRMSRRPDALFRRIALGVLVFSLLPDLWLLTEGAREAFPGATWAGVGVLMAMHVAAAAAILWALTGGASPTGPATSS